MSFDFSRTYSKKEAQAILSLSTNELNKWLGFLDAVEPKEGEKSGGRGRPAHTLGINDLYKLGVFKTLKTSGFDRKTVAKMIDEIDQKQLVKLIGYAESKGIIHKLTIISALWDFLTDHLDASPEEKEIIQPKFFNKMKEMEPNGSVFLWFCSEQDWKGHNTILSFPVIEKDSFERVPDEFVELMLMAQTLKTKDLAHALNLGKAVSDVQYQIEMYFDEDAFWERTFEEIGWDFIDEIHKVVYSK